MSNKVYIKLPNQLNTQNTNIPIYQTQQYGGRRLEGQKGLRMASPYTKAKLTRTGQDGKTTKGQYKDSAQKSKLLVT